MEQRVYPKVKWLVGILQKSCGVNNLLCVNG